MIDKSARAPRGFFETQAKESNTYSLTLALPRHVIEPLVLRHDLADLGRHFLRARNELLYNPVAAQSLLEVHAHDAERENIPILRLGADPTYVLEIERLDLLTENRSLINEDDLVGGDEDEIIRPVDVRLEKIEEHEYEPQQKEDAYRPSGRSAKHHRDDSRSHEKDGQNHLAQTRKEE